MQPFRHLSLVADRLLRLFGRPVRRARGRRGVVIQPYRGYGSSTEAFLIGRVFYQSTDRRAGGALARKVRDVLRRIGRRAISGAHIRAVFYGAETTAETDKDGYFRLHLFPADPVPTGKPWHEVSLILEEPERVSAKGKVYVPPPQARLAVISDIDDTVMYTGVANKIAMLWRLFAQGVDSRTAFPGVAPLYRALHGGVSGQEQNPMLYVSRAPW